MPSIRNCNGKTRAGAFAKNRAKGAASKLPPSRFCFVSSSFTPHFLHATLASTPQLTFDQSCISRYRPNHQRNLASPSPASLPGSNPSPTASPSTGLSLLPASRSSEQYKITQRTFPTVSRDSSSSPRAGMFQRPSHTPAPPVQTSASSSLTAWSHSEPWQVSIRCAANLKNS